MPHVQLTCPSCGELVEIGATTCPHCGVNVKSGESFEGRVKRARGKARHPEHFAGTVLVSCTVLLGVTLFGGYMYQKRIHKLMVVNPEGLSGYVTGLKILDEMIRLKAEPKPEQEKMAEAERILKANEWIFHPDMFKEQIAGIEDLRAEGDVGNYGVALGESIINSINYLDSKLKDETGYDAKKSVVGSHWGEGRPPQRDPGYSVRQLKSTLRGLKVKVEAKLTILRG